MNLVGLGLVTKMPLGKGGAFWKTGFFISAAKRGKNKRNRERKRGEEPKRQRKAAQRPG